jgi:hypothetical protein
MDQIFLPAEYVGEAQHEKDGTLLIGCGDNVVQIRLSNGEKPGWWNTGTVPVYIRRLSSDLSVVEIIIARHDGLAQEALDAENEEAENYPLGPKEYWRSKMVGKYIFGEDNHKMTEEDFENYWEDDII